LVPETSKNNVSVNKDFSFWRTNRLPLPEILNTPLTEGAVDREEKREEGQNERNGGDV